MLQHTPKNNKKNQTYSHIHFIEKLKNDKTVNFHANRKYCLKKSKKAKNI